MKNEQPTRFLIVDDFAPMRKTIQSNLFAAGYNQVTLASNGKDALNILSKETIDCIISDWNMPVMNGLDLLKNIRQDDKLKNLHFMLVTAESSRDSIQQAIDAGVSDFLVKPFTQGSLRNKIEQMLSRPVAIYKKETTTDAEVIKQKKVAKYSGTGRILVVDDAPINIDVIVGLLKEQYTITAAQSGKKALEIINSGKAIDLILLDIMMPEMDGMEVCRTLKENQDTQHIPILFLTAKSAATDIAMGLEAGAVDYITKPVSAAVLRARVKTHLQLKHAQDSLKDEVDSLVENARLREDVELITRHDLKSPLTAIINQSDALLLDNQYMRMEQKLQIETMREASYEMLRMINNSLDLYKMETGTYKLNAKPIEITAVALKVCNEARGYGNEFDVSLSYEAPDPFFILGEELLCFSMLSNLIRNAVEASPQKGKVNVKVSSDDKIISISIHNSGAIPEEVRDHFFDKYSTANKDRGTGLGTYSAYLLASVQGGEITFTTSEEAGTTLEITLPKTKPS